MDFNELWENYKEGFILVVVTAISTLLIQRILPSIWKWVTILGRKIGQLVGKEISDAQFEARYLEWLIEENRYLKVRGIRTRSTVGVKLEQVYISLQLVDPTVPQFETFDELERYLLKGGKYTKGKGPRLKSSEPERVLMGEAMKLFGERLVILGGPGTGKTTLLSYLALKFAQAQTGETLDLEESRLPILLPLRDLVQKDQSLVAASLAGLCAAPEIAPKCPRDFFTKRLEAGQCIVLLDGMDEVTNEAERHRIAEQIEDFVNTYPNNRFIVTSRPAGYRGVALAGFGQLNVCDFSDEDVEAFARHWSLAVELAARETNTEIAQAAARRQAERNAEDLINAIQAHPRVRQLTINPLLLTIVAMVHRYRAKLPNRRAELYDECVQVLLGYWDEAKRIAGQLDPARKRRVLEPLAFKMHAQGFRDLPQAEVERAIAEALPSIGEEAGQAGEFLKDVRERSGLLMERGLGIYGFTHLTFQEYLAASHLLDRQEEGREFLIERRRDPWWREVLLLYAGMGDATPLVEGILSQQDDLFNSNLFLAAHCLVDRLNIEPRVEDNVLAQLMAVFCDGEYYMLRQQTGEVLAALNRSPSKQKIAKRLLQALGDEREDVRVRAISALRNATGQPGVVGALIQALSDEGEDVRTRAVDVLSNVTGQPGVAEALFQALGDESQYVQIRTVFALSKSIGQRGITEALLQALGDEREYVRGRAAEALSEATDQPGVAEALLQALVDQSSSVRGSAAEALSEATSQLGIAEALLQALDDQSDSVRESAAHVLGNAASHPGVTEALLRALCDQSYSVRGSAAKALGNAADQPGVAEALLEALGDESEIVRFRAVESLGNAAGQPGVAEALRRALGDENSIVREYAAQSLVKVMSQSGLTETLLEALGDQSEIVRSRAAESLGAATDQSGVAEALLQALGDQSESVRGSASYALGNAAAQPGIAGALLQALGDESEYVRGRTASALGKATNQPGITEALLQALGDQSETVRGSAAYALGNAVGQPGIAEVLLKVLNNENEYVQFFTASGLANLVMDSRQKSDLLSPESLTILRGLLENDIHLLFSVYPGGERVNDVAWWILREISSELKEPLYEAGEGGEE